MPPQNQNSPSQVPGEDVLLETLRRSKITDDERQQIWDAYHTQGDEDAFVGALNKLDIQDDVKQTLYDMRYKGFKNLPTKGPEVVSPQLTGPSTGGRFLTPPTGPTSIAPAPALSFLERAKAAITAHIPYFHPETTAEEMSIVPDITAGMTAKEQEQHPILTGVGHVLTGLGSAPNVAIIAGTAGLGEVPTLTGQVLRRGLAAKFGADAMEGAMHQYPELKAAIDRGDESEAKRLATEYLLGITFGVAGAKEAAAKSEPLKVKTTQQEEGSSPEGQTPQEARIPNTTTPAEGPQLSFNFNQGHTEAKVGPPVFRDAELPPTIAPEPRTSFQGAKGPAITGLRPQDIPEGRTIGMLPLEPSELIPSALKPEATPFNQLSVEELGKATGLIVRPLMAGDPTSPLMFEKPELVGKGLQVTIPRSKLVDASQVQQALETKIGEVKPVEVTPFITITPNFKDIRQTSLRELANIYLDIEGNTLSDTGQRAFIYSEMRKRLGSSSEVENLLQDHRELRQQDIDSPTPEGPPSSFELPNQLKFRLAQLPDAERQVTEAINDNQRQAAQKRLNKLQSEIDSLTRQHLNSLSPEQLVQLRDSLQAEADVHATNANTIDQIRQQDPMAKAIREEMRSGQPVKSPAGGTTIIGSTHADIRSVLHEILGDETSLRFDEIAINQRAKLREQGIDPDFAQPEGYRRLAPEEFQSIREEAQRELKEIQSDLKAKVSIAVQDLAEKNPAKVMDMGEEEFTRRASSNIASKLLETKDESGRSIKERVTELRQIIGRDPQRPVYVRKGRPTVEEGKPVQLAGSIAEKTLPNMEALLGRKLRKLPSDTEMASAASKLRSKAGLLQRIAQGIDKALKVKYPRGRESEAGFIGQARKPIVRKIEIPKTEELLKRAEALGYEVWKTDADNPSGNRGWLTEDGYFIEIPWNHEHDSAAYRILGDNTLKAGDAEDAFMANGIIRKASHNSYTVNKVSDSNINAIENDAIRSGRFSKGILIDQNQKPYSIEIDDGWNNLKTEVAKQIRRTRLEAGKISVGPLTASSIGSVTGAGIGLVTGGPPGALLGGGIGWAAGFATSAVLHAPIFREAYARVSPILKAAGIRAQDWFHGPLQRPAVLPDMEGIIEAQHSDLRGPKISLLQRIAQLPGDIQYNLFDRLVFLNDRTGSIVNFLMRFDPRGREFRALRGQLSVDDSPYVSAWLAAGGGGGPLEAHLLAYKDIYKEAQKDGLVNNLAEYLNLKGYQRVYDVLNERLNEHNNEIQTLEAQLQNRNLSPRQRVALEDDLAEAKSARNDLISRMNNRELTPAGYDPAKINHDLTQLQSDMDPTDFNHVQQLANRVFDMNRKILDLVHDNGIISDADYQKYVARGNEYIPMHRILESINDNEFRFSGKSPLYLRQQNVIKALMGSERINRDPIIASADANLEAMKEVMRNGVIKDFLQLAQQDPNGVGQLFKQVPKGYKAGPDESLIGVYEKGEAITYATPKWLGESLKGVSPISADVVGGTIARFLKNILQKGATGANLGFSIPNAMRDLSEMAALSEGGLGLKGKNLPKDAAALIAAWGRSFIDSLRKSPKWQEYMQSGAAYSSLQRNITPEHFINLHDLEFHQKVGRVKLVDAIMELNAAIEDATKMATYHRLREAGYTPKAAAFETRRYGGSPDFARAGAMTPAVNLYWMFFNANLQGLARVFARAREHPARVGMALGVLSAMALTLNGWNQLQQDDKGQPLMRKVPINDRENYFVILSGETYTASSGAQLPLYVRIPKPHFIKLLYNPIENVVNKITGNEVRSGNQLALDAINNAIPGQFNLQEGKLLESIGAGIVASANPVIKAPLEQLTNKTFGFGEPIPIIPKGEEGIESRFQFGPGTSATARQMGQGGIPGAEAGVGFGGALGYLLAGGKGALLGGTLGGAIGAAGISPRRLESGISSVTAGVGQLATTIADPFMSAYTGSRRGLSTPEQIRQTPFVGPIIGRFGPTAVDQEERTLESNFYDRAQAVQVPVQTLNMLMKRNPAAAPAYLQAHKEEIAVGRFSEQMIKRLGQINEMQRMIQQNESISDEQRMNALRNIHQAKLQVLKAFNEMLDKTLSGGMTGKPASADGWRQ